jgi:serine/threonine protein kinase
MSVGEMAMTLEEHGFVGVALNDSYSNLCDVIPRAREIARVGNEQIVSGDPWRFLNRSLTGDGRHVGWCLKSLYKEGSYGKIFKAFRMIVARRADDGLFDVAEEPHEVIVKQTHPPARSRTLPAEDIEAHVTEALLHVLAWRIVQRTATPWAVPRPYEVFGDHSPALPGWRTMSLCMSYVRGRTLHSYIEKYWSRTAPATNVRPFLEIVGQLAYILSALQVGLRLNHRDVKVNNVLIRNRRSGGPAFLEMGGATLVTGFEITLIDFGFACIGCPPPKAPVTSIQAGSWFPMGEMCCKAGRDLAQLIFCIHCYFPLHVYLPVDLYREVSRWMMIPYAGGVVDALHGFTEEGRPRRSDATGVPEYHKGVYEFLRRPDVDPATCDPRRIFAECCRLKNVLCADS